MVRPLIIQDIIALRELADKGPMHCDCESDPELCHCSTIIMLCDEWAAFNGYNPQPVGDNEDRTDAAGKLKRLEC